MDGTDYQDEMSNFTFAVGNTNLLGKWRLMNAPCSFSERMGEISEMKLAMGTLARLHDFRLLLFCIGCFNDS